MAIPQLNQFDDLRKEVARRYEQLHPDVKAALVSVDTAGAVYEIGKKFGLNVEKTGYLADVIGYTIIGLLPVTDFVQNLKNMLEVDGGKAEEISREVNAKIFLAIREQLKKTHGEKWDERSMREQPRTAMPSEQPRTAPTPPAAPMPQVPKSPWEIRPEGMRRETRDMRQETWEKSVIPPVSRQPTTDNLQQTTKAMEAEVKKPPMPPEAPKTRETPQPAPAPRAPEVLKEIRPLQPTTYNQQPTTAPKPEMPKAAPPTGLPIMKEAEKLMQTPELNKPTTNNQQPTTPPSVKPITSNQQPTTPPMPQPPQPLASKPPVPQEVPQQKPQAPQPAKTPAQKYALDPYREPIE